MRKIQFTQSIDGFHKGDIVDVENNVAHRYIDRGQAVLYNRKISDYDDRMMGGKGKKAEYLTK